MAARPLTAAQYYVDDTTGTDSNSGISIDAPWKSLSHVKEQIFSPGDSILLKCGSTWNEGFSLRSSGDDAGPILVGSYGSGPPPVIPSLTIYGDHTIVQDLIVDSEKADKDAVQVRGARNCVLRRLTIQNGTRDGIDVSDAENLLIEVCHIHHFLAGSFTDQKDAHGIVVNRSRGITVRNTEIHHVSGDSFQADPSRDAENLSNDILIENCHFWTGPLTKDFNSGWQRTDDLPDYQKQYPGENAIDTKVLKSGWEKVSRMRITVRDMLAHGWKNDNFIANKAVFNLKEKIEAVIDGVTVYDSEIAFRLRGTRGNAEVTIKNAVIYKCEKAIRAEDNLENLKVYNTTFGHLINTQLEFAGGSYGTGTWEFLNNAFINEKPAIADEPSNMVVSSGDLELNFLDYGSGNYRLKRGSSLIGAGKTLDNVIIDREARIRNSPYDVGAYAFWTDSQPGGTPIAPKNLRILK